MKTVLWFCLGWALWPIAASAQHQGHNPVPCQETGLHCATSATPAFAADGTIWLVWAAGGRVMAGHSGDLGRSFDRIAAVNQETERIDNGPDARPKIVIDTGGRLIVAYAVFQDDRYNGRVMVSRSVDGGASFSRPQPITDDMTSQRFETLAVDPEGNLFATWIDKRTAVAAKAAGKPYAGAALTYSWSSDGGERFQPARIALDNVCECCRLGVAFAGTRRPVILFRNVFGRNIRDHAVLVFADAETPGPPHRVSVDDWQIEACPHHGPSLAMGETGIIHAAWFTAGKVRQGLFYARSADGGEHFTAPLPTGDPGRRPARPYLLASGHAVRLVWKEFDGEVTAVKEITSPDDGKTWSTPTELATTADASDHPLLLSNGAHSFLSWMTRGEGYRLLPLDDMR
jgi:hypothetical protein